MDWAENDRICTAALLGRRYIPKAEKSVYYIISSDKGGGYSTQTQMAESPAEAVEQKAQVARASYEKWRAAEEAAAAAYYKRDREWVTRFDAERARVLKEWHRANHMPD
jgi:hypothetical protein